MLGTRDAHRSVLSEAVVPPPDYTFDEGMVTTYSLDLATLLTLPVHLVLADPSSRSQLLENPVAMLDALRRARDRITVFCEQGRMLAPRNHHVLYALLEPVIHEVVAPHGGAFHPKLWVLKFRPTSGDGPILMRALVLSRNLTDDRSWDLALRLDGQLTSRRQESSGPLRDLLQWLGAHHTRRPEAAERLHRLANEVGRTAWQIPAPFETLSFTVLGLKKRKWIPGWPQNCKQRVVMSPFVDNGALQSLLQNTESLKCSPSESGETTASRGPLALISRPEQLVYIKPAILRQFGAVYTLKEHVETEDGEAPDASKGAVNGLHAKAVLSWKGFRFRAAIGSANATSRALIRGENVEVMAILEGRGSQWKPDVFLSEDEGIGDLLEQWEIPDQEEAEEPEEDDGKVALEQAATRLALMHFHAHCESADGFVVELTPDGPVDLSGVSEIRVWPTTLGQEHARDGSGLSEAQPVRLGFEAAALITGLICFELKNSVGQCERFVRNIEVEGLPEDREGAIIEAILQGKEGFLNYLRYLLGAMGSEDASGAISGSADGAWHLGLAGLDGRALLESLTRVLARDSDRLHQIRSLVNHLRKSDEGRSMLPDGFDAMWSVYEQVLPAIEVPS